MWHSRHCQGSRVFDVDEPVWTTSKLYYPWISRIADSEELTFVEALGSSRYILWARKILHVLGDDKCHRSSSTPSLLSILFILSLDIGAGGAISCSATCNLQQRNPWLSIQVWRRSSIEVLSLLWFFTNFGDSHLQHLSCLSFLWKCIPIFHFTRTELSALLYVVPATTNG